MGNNVSQTEDKPSWRRGRNLRKKKGLSDHEIEEALRENYGPMRTTRETKDLTVKAIAFNKFSQTLETSRSSPEKGMDPDEKDDSLSTCNDGSISGNVLMNNLIDDTCEVTIDTPHPFDSPQPSQRTQLITPSTKKKSKPNLTVMVIQGDDDVPDAKDGKEGGRTPRTPSQISPGGGLHIGAFTIHTSGTTMISRDGYATSPHPFLRGGARDFIEIQLLGKGAQGYVSEALHIPTLTVVALKTLPIFDAEDIHHLANELGVLYKNLAELKLIDGSLQEMLNSDLGTLSKSSDENDSTSDQLSDVGTPNSSVGKQMQQQQHKLHRKRKSSVRSVCPHLLALYDAFLDPSSGMVNLVIEHMDGGSLQDVVNSGGCTNEEILADIAHQMLLGLQFLHRNNVAHRDLKPGNVLLNCDGIVKLADFGLSKDLSNALGFDNVASFQSNPHSFVGTMSYMAPERISNRLYGLPADVWSFGLTILAVILGRLPLPRADERPFADYWELLCVICDDPIPVPILSPPLSADLVLMISACLEKSSDYRPKVEDLLDHAFFLHHNSILWSSLMEDEIRVGSIDEFEVVKGPTTGSTLTPTSTGHKGVSSIHRFFTQRDKDISAKAINILSADSDDGVDEDILSPASSAPLRKMPGGATSINASTTQNPSQQRNSSFSNSPHPAAAAFGGASLSKYDMRDSPIPLLSTSPSECEFLIRESSNLRAHSISSNGSARSLSALAHKQSFRKASRGKIFASADSDSEHSDLSSVVGSDQNADEDVIATATRLEHLERILVKANSTLQKEVDESESKKEELARGMALSHTNSDDSHSDDSDGRPRLLHRDRRGSRSFRGENIFREVEPPLRKLPNTITDIQKWRHLAYQLNLPTAVIISMARSIIHEKFFVVANERQAAGGFADAPTCTAKSTK